MPLMPVGVAGGNGALYDARPWNFRKSRVVPSSIGWLATPPDGSRVILKEDGTNIFERFRDVHPAYVDPAGEALRQRCARKFRSYRSCSTLSVENDPLTSK